MNQPQPTPVTAQLAEFASCLQWSKLPLELQELMPVLLVDIFRAAAAGRGRPWTRSALTLIAGSGGSLRASVFFSDAKPEVTRAAFVNGIACGSLDWDDAHVAAILHPGIVVWPAALAMAEATGASGKELLAAAVVGYEVAIRIGMSIQPEHSLRGFQGTPTCGTFGAAAACARLLKLDPERTRNALGIASSFAGGLSQFFISGSDVKRIHAGKANANGMEAALLAAAGLTGPKDAIEGAQGFARAFSDRFDPQAVVNGLGVQFPTLSVSLKPHAGSVRMQSAIEAAIELTREGVKAQDIATIEVGVHRAMIGKLTDNNPLDHQQAQLSTPYAVAMAFVLAPKRGQTFPLTIDDFAELLQDEQVRTLAARTLCVADSEVERLTTREGVPGRVACVLKDGTRRERFVRHAKGSPQNPMTREEVCERFNTCAAEQFERTDVEQWLRYVSNVEYLDDVSGLLSLRPVNNC